MLHNGSGYPENLQICRAPALALCLIAALSVPTAFGQVVAPADDLEVLQTMTPRLAGSEAERVTMHYVESRLQTMGAVYTVLPSATMSTAAGALVASVPGRSERTLALVVPLDHSADAASGYRGSAGIVAALRAVELAVQSPPPLTLRVIFIGGEHGPADRTGLGSARLVADSALQDPTAVIYLRFDAVGDPILIRTSGRVAQTPRWLLSAAAHALDQIRLPFSVRSTSNQLSRIGVPIGSTMIEPFLAAGHPAIELAGRHSGVDSGTNTVRIDSWIDDLGHFVESLSDRMVTVDVSGWEQYYLFMQVGPLRLTLDEIGVVASVMVALSFSIALVFLLPRTLRRYRRQLLRLGWMMPLLAVGTYVALTAATVLLSSLLIVRDLPSLWQTSPALALAFKGSTTLLLIVIPVKVLAMLLAPRLSARDIVPAGERARGLSLESGVLSAGAAALLPVIIAAAAIIDPAASLPFICAYLGTLLFSLADLRVVKAVWLAAAFAVPAAVVADLIVVGADGLLHVLLLSSGIGNTVLMLALLPFVLMGLRLTLKSEELLAAWAERRRLTPLILLLTLSSAATGTALYVVV